MNTVKMVARLNELADAIANGKTDGEFTMRVPAEPERDADLVLSAVAARIAELEAEVERLRGEADPDCCGNCALRMSETCRYSVSSHDEPCDVYVRDSMGRAEEAP